MEKRSPVNHRDFITYFDYHNSILSPSRVSILQNTVAVLTSQRQGGLTLICESLRPVQHREKAVQYRSFIVYRQPESRIRLTGTLITCPGIMVSLGENPFRRRIAITFSRISSSGCRMRPATFQRVSPLVIR